MRALCASSNTIASRRGQMELPPGSESSDAADAALQLLVHPRAPRHPLAVNESFDPLTPHGQPISKPGAVRSQLQSGGDCGGRIMTFRRNLIWTSAAFAAALTVGVPSLRGRRRRLGLDRGPGLRGQPGRGRVVAAARRSAVHASSGREGPEGGGVQLGRENGHAAEQRGIRPADDARLFGQGHHAGGRTTLQCDALPDDISYQTSGERIRITGTRPNGQSCSTIEVLGGAYAWNEDILGAGLVPGKGKATPMPATVEERMIRLWANPQGAFKAAFAGTSIPSMTPRPQRLAADVMTIGKTSSHG